MNDSEKPFVCDAIGCNMSFINEDHLTVHKSKHDMMLNLGISNKSNFFIADQTPTPTRFMRNSDEVELFQDLPSDNPFEETFRRAVVAGKNEIITVLESNDNDDALHTSNVFSHTEEFPTNISAVSSENPVLKSEIKTIIESSSVVKSVSIDESLQSVLTENGTSIENSSIQNIENEYLLIDRSKQKSKCNIAKKQAILERNRASSMRARAKRKVWIEQLQQSLRIANESNVTLQTQVKIMQAQITKLKTLLLAHKDCPVTKAMEGGI
ncbi:PREDICTED: cyclic AMP-dependent transcription factor ATF-2 [Ceratosolen solmsi marchali]|uniref:Cyclic AMP-dependent transcription factor ATF-2 n=1 Tax=Ceratosolen solmsi marchali TaxID=326594 RepID=A0AAJ6YEH9_9HYME|nr:PREDICTED: cyclic AMP-dependent transcription factor ATF-2 [Ceratosolen solmsi marchali]